MESYKKMLEYIETLNKHGIKLGLDRIYKIMKILGNPQDTYKSIIISGTNGKGSTCAYLNQILLEHGYKVGFYSSPHLCDIRERFLVGNKMISKKDFLQNSRVIKEITEKNKITLTQFEFLTAVAFNFYKGKIDWLVLEVGMGGRLDATNVAQSKAAIITNIDLEHQQYLGQTKEEIAFEKSGIIKNQNPLITTEKDPNIIKIFKNNAKLKNSEVVSIGEQFICRVIKCDIEGTIFDFEGLGYNLRNLEVKMLGAFQAENASAAIAALIKTIKIDNKKLISGLIKARWAGRFQILSKKPLRLIDCCHNPHGAAALANAIKEVFPNKKFDFIFGISDGRDPSKMLPFLIPLANSFIFTKAKWRGIDPNILLETAKKIDSKVTYQIIDNVSDAIKIKSKSQIICGSIFLVGEALEEIRKGD